MSTHSPLPMIQVIPSGAPSPDRSRLVRRAQLLAWLGLGWHMVQAAVAIVAGIAGH